MGTRKEIDEHVLMCARTLYEETELPMADIATLVGVCTRTLQTRAALLGWTPRESSRARRRCERGTSSDVATLTERVRETVDREIANAERGLAAAGTRTRTRDPERTARTLASLVKTLSELKRLQPNETASVPQVEDDEIDIDEYRRDLARRLDQLAIEEANGEDTRRTAAR